MLHQSKALNSRIKLAATAAGMVCLVASSHVSAGPIEISQYPLFVASREAPLNLLIVGRDHKNWYEAYNDASDLNGDGQLDVGYKPETVTYFGYFDSFKCYSYNGSEFVPVSTTSTKRCGGSWSGDFLNYLTTARFDALKKVLYGGTRVVDTAGASGRTVLERSYIPQDGHSWGKEYTSVVQDGYDIRDYAPLNLPVDGKRHLFANTTLSAGSIGPPLLRVLENSRYRIWEWVAIERLVAGDDCVPATGGRTTCTEAAGVGWEIVPASRFTSLRQETFMLDIQVDIGTSTPWRGPNGDEVPRDDDVLAFSDFELLRNGSTTTSGPGGSGGYRRVRTPQYRCGSANVSQISGDGNPYVPGTNNRCESDRYLTYFTGNFRALDAGTYTFGIDGDDAVAFLIRPNNTGPWINVVQWGGLHAAQPPTPPYGPNRIGSVDLPAGTHPIRFFHVDNAGGDSYALWWQNNSPGSVRTDYRARVEVCVPGLLEDNCLAYRNPVTGDTAFKPTGLLHEYTAPVPSEFGVGSEGVDVMKFGLLTGSFTNNTRGGVMRRNLGSFQGELNVVTIPPAGPIPEVKYFDGTFSTTVGIVRTLDRLRITGFSGSTHGDNCGWIVNGPINNGQCRSWGNPLAEMMWEGLRYFAGARAPTPAFDYSRTTTSLDDNRLGLPKLDAGPADPALTNSNTQWTDPFGTGNANACAKPFQTVISDVNPSYDSDDLPGANFGGSPGGVIPPLLSSFSASTVAGSVWSQEYGGSGSYFIGESGGVDDDAPTAKTVSSFADIRGLSPEEPTKGGSYYAAALAYYARTNDISERDGRQDLQTFSVALASPLPRIEFPTPGGGLVTLIPFAKSVDGFSINYESFAPTNTIVDFFVERIVNLPGQEDDPTINEGRPYARFRINYEDVEQGADHDMDAIVLYEIALTDAGTVTVALESQYAAGSIEHKMGYVISGTTADGIYLEVRDRDTSASSDRPYPLQTPPGVTAGGCASLTGTCVNPLPLTAEREFTPGTNPGASLLRDPLWYAAKYGGFLENRSGSDNNGQPNLQSEWDEDNDGQPDSYFLVTNALTLKDQLNRAFREILRRASPAGAVATNSTRVDSDTLAYQASYDTTDWTGDVVARELNADGTLGAQAWSHAEEIGLQGFASRRMFTMTLAGEVEPFTPSLPAAVLGLIDPNPANGFERAQVIVDYIRGDQQYEERFGNATYQFRDRSKLVGDIVGSSPAVDAALNFGYCSLPSAGETCQGTGEGAYRAFLESKVNRRSMLYVGVNDGTFRGIDAEESGGRELFSYVPREVLPKLRELTNPLYDHLYFVDGTPSIGDAFINGSWRTIVIGSTGAGGRSYFALDVTNPDGFTEDDVLWEFTHPELGQSLGQAKIVRLNTGQWAAVFGNGYNSNSNKAGLFVVNLATGALIKFLQTTEGTATDPNGLATPAPVDITGLALTPDDVRSGSGDAITDIIYAGDLHGNLWKFDLTSSSSASWVVDFGGRPLFQAMDDQGRRQAITAAPNAAAFPLGGLLVYFGTGRFLTEEDKIQDPINDPIDAFYAVRDSDTRVTGRAELVQQRLVGSTPAQRVVQVADIDWDSDFGWYMDFTGTAALEGERVLAEPLLAFGLVLYNTYSPTAPDPCAGVFGSGFLMFQNALSGSGSVPRSGSAGQSELGGAVVGDQVVGSQLPNGTPPGAPVIINTRDSFLALTHNGAATDSARPAGTLVWKQLR